jgi:hypothetical protein
MVPPHWDHSIRIKLLSELLKPKTKDLYIKLFKQLMLENLKGVMMLNYKFRIYPSKNQMQILAKSLIIRKGGYNFLLEPLKKARKKEKEINPQALVAKIKEKKPKFKEVYSKALQMVNYQLKSNPNALKKLITKEVVLKKFFYSLRSLQKEGYVGKSFLWTGSLSIWLFVNSSFSR